MDSCCRSLFYIISFSLSFSHSGDPPFTSSLSCIRSLKKNEWFSVVCLATPPFCLLLRSDNTRTKLATSIHAFPQAAAVHALHDYTTLQLLLLRRRLLLCAQRATKLSILIPIREQMFPKTHNTHTKKKNRQIDRIKTETAKKFFAPKHPTPRLF